MMNKPLVTIVVPYYNHSDYIEDCIHSLMKQSFKDFELIVIDDGSTDNGCVKIEELQKVYNFQFLSKENEGVCATLNLGIKLARGTFFCAIASDDIYHVNKLSIQIPFMLENNLKCTSADSQTFRKLSDIKNDFQKTDEKYSIYNLKDVLYSRANIPAINLVWDTCLLKKLGGYNPETKLEDYDIILKYLTQYEKIIVLANTLSYSRLHDTNTSSDRGLIYREKIKLLDNASFVRVEDINRAILLVRVQMYVSERKVSSLLASLLKVISSGATVELIKLFKHIYCVKFLSKQ